MAAFWLVYPNTLTRSMNQVLKPFTKKFVVYFDDILIFNQSEEEHLKHLRSVLEVLRENKPSEFKKMVVIN